jgi:hypothetical protein
MNDARQSPAEETAALLVQAQRSGSPVLIPGAFEKRSAGPRADLPSAPDVVTGHAHPIVVSDLARLEYEREGGGAPSARGGRRPGTLGARLWHSLLHPTHVPEIWRRVVPHTS